eukprot:3832635-Pleurochrysis_carterae.AAC.1
MQVRLRLTSSKSGVHVQRGRRRASLRIFSSGHRMNLHSCDVAFIIVNKRFSLPFASRWAKALAFVAPFTLRKHLD